MSPRSPSSVAHRTPTVLAADPKAARPPRILHVAFSTYVAKEFVRNACITKFKENTFQGHKIYVSEDFSKRVAEQRKGKLDQLKELRKEGKKPYVSGKAGLQRLYRETSYCWLKQPFDIHSWYL